MTTPPAVQMAVPQARSASPQLPRWRSVLIEQIRATGYALRTPAMLVLVLAVLATLMIVLRIVSRELSFDLDAEPSPVYGLVGALLPVVLWAKDQRFGPGFFWTLPVDRRSHALTKVLAGWLWLMGGVALSVLWLVAITLASGGQVLPPETINLLTAASVPVLGVVDPATVQSVRWVPGAFIGVVPFTAATATYLLASALWLGSRRPLWWVIGSVLAFAFASAASDVASRQLGMALLHHAPERALEWLLENPYGLDALFTARTATLDTGMSFPTGERVSIWSAVPEMAHWLKATLLWTGIGLVALWAAASRQVSMVQLSQRERTRHAGCCPDVMTQCVARDCTIHGMRIAPFGHVEQSEPLRVRRTQHTRTGHDPQRVAATQPVARLEQAMRH